MVPVAGAPFEVAMAFDSIQSGDYVGGALGIVGGVLNAVPAAEGVREVSVRAPAVVSPSSSPSTEW